MTLRRPEISEVIRRHIESGQVDSYSAMPARVERYDAAKQQADCKPVVKRNYVDEAGDDQVEQLPVVPCVPVLFPGGGPFRITFPLAKGDLVLLVFSQLPLDAWVAGDGSEVDPEVRAGPADAIAIPILKTFGAPWQSAPTDHATMGADQGVQLHLRSDVIVAGDEAGADFVALSQKVIDDLNAIKTHFTALEAILTGTVINEPGNGVASALQAALKGAINTSPYPSPASVAATQFKAK